ncbi:MAG: hypothetical protein H7Z43_04300 [Clostridia bacterium]|nr:hypothetical protein [Deltaproteobacteria bacterium]
MTAARDTIGTLIIELHDATFIALAEDVHMFSSGTLATDTHDLDSLLDAPFESLPNILPKTSAETDAATHVLVTRPRGSVTFTCSGRPRFSTAPAEAFYRLPKMIAGTCASWVRGIHIENEKLAVWIDLAQLADTVRGM